MISLKNISEALVQTCPIKKLFWDMRTLCAESLQKKDSTAYVFLEIFQYFMNSCSKKTFPDDFFCHLISQSQISFTEINTLSIVAQNKLSNQYLHLNSQNQPTQIIKAIF